jgi:hydrophobe/amphiphile efflux-1 (HAE1) family protein
MNLPKICVQRPTTTLMVFLAIILLGVISLVRLPLDMLPEIDVPSISVITRYPGASAEDVEEKVTKILEDRLTTIPDLKEIVSTSKQDISVITLSFEWDTDLDTRANDAREAIGWAEIILPEDAEKSLVLKFDISNFPIMGYGFMAERSYYDLKEIIEDEVADPLKRIPGVGSVIVRGGPRRQVNVELDRQLLATHHVTPQDVVRAIYNENQSNPAGDLKIGVKDYSLRVPGEFKQVEPMKKIVVANQEGRIVRLEDVAASVEFGFAEETQPVRSNQKRGIYIMVMRQSGANTVKVARAVDRKLKVLVDGIRKDCPDVEVVNLWSNSENIVNMIKDLSRTLLMGAALSVLAVLLFLRQSRATFIIALSIPFSLIGALIVTYIFGYTINMLTLFALTIGVGMVVDNSIVILENISRHREEGESLKEGAVYGSNEVVMAVTASTLTTVAIFLPLVFVKGIIKILFAQFAVVLCVVILASLFSALTLTPMLSSTILPERWKERRSGGMLTRLYEWSERFYDRMIASYGSALSWALGHRKTVILVAVGLFALTLMLLPLIGSEFFAEEDQGFLNGTIHLPVGTRVEETDRVMRQIEKIIHDEISDKEIIASFARCGQSEEGISSVFGDEGPHIGEFGVRLVPKAQRRRGFKEIAEALRRRIAKIPEIERFRIDTQDPMSGILLGGERPVTVNIFGKDMEKTDRVAVEVKKILESVPGTKDVEISRVKGNPEFWIDVDREKASSMGLNVSGVHDTIRASFYGREASKYRVGGDEYDIFVRLAQKDRMTPEDIRELGIRLPNGEFTQVANLANLIRRFGPVDIERKDRERLVNVGASVGRDRSLGEITAETKDKLESLRRGHAAELEGVDMDIAGQAEEQQESFFWMKIAILIGGILVYMVMASQFESLLHPFVVMFSVPFAFTGVIWALFVGGFYISVTVFIGMLLLIGIVVNNAIVLVDYTNILRARGLGIKEAALEAGKKRLRPVLMTAITTIVALIPMTLTRGQGSEVWNPLGATVMGGLLVSTLVTLILIPTLYTIFEGRSSAKRERKAIPL